MLLRAVAMLRWLIVLPLVGVSAPAWALKPGKHRDLAETACAAQHLPDAFCRRMGQEAYQTDYEEWDRLAAHAQRERGQARCDAADAALARVDQLARAVVADAHAARFDEAAAELGRVVHTLQDECAHHGITNEEHAYYSLDQTCTGDQVSPDVQAEAIACADARTQRAFAAVAAALADVSWNGVDYICRDSENRDSCAAASLPSPVMVCDFLALYADWDGGDSSWNGAIVGPELETVFAAALAGEQTSRSACAGDPRAIDPLAPRAMVSTKDLTCTLTEIACLGKVDGEDGDPEPARPDGCAVGGTPALWLAALALTLRSRSRRR